MVLDLYHRGDGVRTWQIRPGTRNLEDLRCVPGFLLSRAGLMAAVCRAPLVADGTRGGKCQNPASRALLATNHLYKGFPTSQSFLAHQKYSERCFKVETLPIFLTSRLPIVSVPPGPAWGEEPAGGSAGQDRVGPPSSESARPDPPCSALGPSVGTGSHLPFLGLSHYKQQPGPGMLLSRGWKAHSGGFFSPERAGDMGTGCLA